MKLSIFMAVLALAGLVRAMPPVEAEEPLYIGESDNVEDPVNIGDLDKVEDPVDIGELDSMEGPVHMEEPVFIEELDNGVEALGRNNILLHSAQVSMGAVANTVRTLNWSWRGAASRRISSWRAVVIGQSATITRTAGGVGTNHLSLRITSGRGRGFNYRLEIWGR